MEDWSKTRNFRFMCIYLSHENDTNMNFANTQNVMEKDIISILNDGGRSMQQRLEVQPQKMIDKIYFQVDNKCLVNHKTTLQSRWRRCTSNFFVCGCLSYFKWNFIVRTIGQLKDKMVSKSCLPISVECWRRWELSCIYFRSKIKMGFCLFVWLLKFGKMEFQWQNINFSIKFQSILVKFTWITNKFQFHTYRVGGRKSDITYYHIRQKWHRILKNIDIDSEQSDIRQKSDIGFGKKWHRTLKKKWQKMISDSVQCQSPFSKNFKYLKICE